MDYLPTIHTRVFSRNQELTYKKKKEIKNRKLEKFILCCGFINELRILIIMR